MLEQLILTLKFYFYGLIKAFVDSMCRVFESNLEPSLKRVTEPHESLRVQSCEFMTLRVAQFSLKIAHFPFSMVFRGPRACGRLNYFITIKVRIAKLP